MPDTPSKRSKALDDIKARLIEELKQVPGNEISNVEEIAHHLVKQGWRKTAPITPLYTVEAPSNAYYSVNSPSSGSAGSLQGYVPVEMLIQEANRIHTIPEQLEIDRTYGRRQIRG